MGMKFETNSTRTYRHVDIMVIGPQTKSSNQVLAPEISKSVR